MPRFVRQWCACRLQLHQCLAVSLEVAEANPVLTPPFDTSCLLWLTLMNATQYRHYARHFDFTTCNTDWVNRQSSSLELLAYSLRGIFLRQPEICRGKPLSCDLMMMQPDEYGIGDQDTGIIQQMGNHTEGHETLVKASMEYPQMYPDKTYDHHFDDYDAFTTLRLDSYTGFSSGCCSASALGELLRRRQRLLLYPP